MAQVRRVFLDANILFTAAHNPEGICYGLIQEQKKLKIDLISSTYAYEEARHNIGLKFPDKMTSLEKIKKKLKLAEVSIDEKWNPLHLPADDLPIFQAALNCKCEFLLSGDKKAFGRWMDKAELCQGITILTPRQFNDKILLKLT